MVLASKLAAAAVVGLTTVAAAASGASVAPFHGSLRLRGGGRKYFLAGNWKMNPGTLEEAKALASAVVKSAEGQSRDQDVCVCCPYPFLAPVAEICKGTKVSVGAEDVFTEEKGAFTGGVSISQLKSVGVKYVVVGHSERRHGNIASETDNTFHKKTRVVLDGGLEAIVCIGETKQEYEAQLCNAVCDVQIRKALAGVTKEEMARITIAYEPVWAIGTGLVATPEAAQAVHAHIRATLVSMYDQETADGVRIQYGGSVAPDNVNSLMACPDIDGALVGGASLLADKFDKIVNFSQ
ncbi:Triosephosphate isomerase [Baffinella frigidus]|nr:Triosephosphate isomerase [Cryptophyta sp. CCMP2293]|eukprot:CAMPEP_0180142726 /NCGR_PEP_ID=MMETSP0986-20121125/15761_1 /TAXON_ID=697907 /ORGANISM="non described non described, Strain CCMP2293" /LENGTH=294 /DNA_ID=CAMNT_0022085997 /DNA_START=41 /DNA_END=925 /DNA_ORIENTATION=+